MQTCKQLGEAEATLAIDAAVAELRRRGKAATVAVGDSHGELIALYRMDGANLPSIVIVQNKVYTAARLRGRSGEIGRATFTDNALMSYHGDDRYVGWDGGVPVMIDGQCVGAVAVSGLAGEEDLAIAEIGVRAVLDGYI